MGVKLGSLIMRMVFGLMAVAAAALMPAAFADDKYALLIGNQNYEMNGWELAKPHDDVDTLQVALIAAGFSAENITLVKDGSQSQMNLAIARFITTLKSSGDDSVGFMYFAGHGASVIENNSASNFFIPVDAKPQSNEELIFVGVSVTDILNRLSTVDAKAIFFIADSCRNPAFSDAAMSTESGRSISVPAETIATNRDLITGSGARGFGMQRLRGHTFIAYATAEGQVAPDDGLFAEVLADYIVRPGIRASEALSEALAEIGSIREHRPYLSPGRAGDFCFNTCTLPDAIPDSAGEAVAWQAFSSLGTEAALQLFLTSYPNGIHAGEARAQLAALETAEETTLADAETAAPVSNRSLIATVREQDFCGAYNVIGADTWTTEFHRPTELNTWHVFVASLPASGSIADAIDARDNWRRRFPNLEFALMPTVARDQSSNRRYAIVLAEGLESGEQAAEIVKFARDCGIAADAFAMQQPF